MNNELFHVGVGHLQGGNSGRYPWGSGENPYQGYNTIYSRYQELLDQGLSAKEVADHFGISIQKLRDTRQLANNDIMLANIARAKSYKDKGWSNVAIAKKMGVADNTVGLWLKPSTEMKAKMTADTAKILADKVNENSYLDVGKYSELEMGITEGRKNAVLNYLKDQGYEVHNIKVPQATNYEQETTVKLLCPPGTEWKDAKNGLDKIKPFTDYIEENGKGEVKLKKINPPVSIDSKRVAIRYTEDGGSEKDGVIELRRGVADLTMGNSDYAQVRIAVDDTHYLKGMAIYSDNLPPGKDILFNTNKHKGTPMLGEKDNTVLKNLKDNPENPFGALIRADGQTYYTDKDGKTKMSVVNKVRQEGDWDEYSKNLSSQMLSKQPKALVDQQLKIASAQKHEEFETIMNLENAAIKKKLLREFADNCDSAAAHLKAAALPRQSTKVILPVPELKDDEIYAPSYRNGENVVLIRYPHAGTFEIPQLKVNNNSKAGQRTIGKTSIDAVGINTRVAERLSGADFDGDTVIVIPVNSKVKIKTSPALEGLKNFDPKVSFPYREGMKVMSEKEKGKYMGEISNLITDMTLGGIKDPNDLACAVRHSMVVIDAVKHNLDYKTSEKVNRIPELKKKYRPEGGGAGTLISRSRSPVYVPQRKQVSPTRDWDPKTGEVTYELTGQLNKKGGTKVQKVDRMSTVKDARELLSAYQSPIEKSYANYANDMKSLANTARKEYLAVKNPEYNPQAAAKYSKEIDSLNAKINVALKNRPKERQAQILARSEYNAICADNPDMDKEDRKKESQRCLTNARAAVGANKRDVLVNITDKEWEAIQSGGIRSSKITQILDNTDEDKFKERSLGTNKKGLTPAQVSMVKAMAEGHYTIQEIADKYNVSTSTISKLIN